MMQHISRRTDVCTTLQQLAQHRGVAVARRNRKRSVPSAVLPVHRVGGRFCQQPHTLRGPALGGNHECGLRCIVADCWRKSVVEQHAHSNRLAASCHVMQRGPSGAVASCKFVFLVEALHFGHERTRGLNVALRTGPHERISAIDLCGTDIDAVNVPREHLADPPSNNGPVHHTAPVIVHGFPASATELAREAAKHAAHGLCSAGAVDRLAAFAGHAQQHRGCRVVLRQHVRERGRFLGAEMPQPAQRKRGRLHKLRDKIRDKRRHRGGCRRRHRCRLGPGSADSRHARRGAHTGATGTELRRHHACCHL
eukprot:comp21328_c0_seq1/m.45827 comp21328_c0_seq1/g.45827  ORF comp21328_c0_seq1/g.45827 comp21328_c0_seq1/m.45827 type:complete len:310 (+) comp21328_c0_seq1:559-1488(+)